MEHSYKEQLERVDRLMTIIEANDQYELVGGLQTSDIVVFACQSMWHLKDWVLNDPSFGAKDVGELKNDIYTSKCLCVCDIANGSKHLSLNRPKVGARLSDRTGIHLEPVKGIFRDIYYVVCCDPLDEWHGIEVGTLLRRCRDEWRSIIDRHWLSRVEDDWAALCRNGGSSAKSTATATVGSTTKVPGG